MMIKKIIKGFIPRGWLLFYHKVLAYLASFLYQNPSEKMVVIGVTGTAGKSTVVYLIGKILEEAGFKVGWTNSINFKIGDREIGNKAKMTMPGRFFMQKILKQMVKAGCKYAVLETSSEGILQSRHLGINYDMAVFTNLSPEHIETHGGFENYKKTKAKLFKKLKNKNNKLKGINGKKIQKAIIANLDDEHADYFLSFPADKYYGFTVRDPNLRMHPNDTNKVKIIEAENIDLAPNGSQFAICNLQFKINLPGKFNIYNSLAAISVAKSLKIPLEIAKKALEKIKGIPGRMEEIISQPFKVIIDYAHTPVELQKVYELLSYELRGKDWSKINQLNNPITHQLICVLGSCGGGRDKWKRPELGKLAAQYCDEIILTDEDPYDENPATIIKEIETGISNLKFSAQGGPPTGWQIPNYEIILDRREAIKKALSLAKSGDVVIITGKGCEPWMCMANGRKIAWDDRKITLEEFTILSAKTIRQLTEKSEQL